MKTAWILRIGLAAHCALLTASAPAQQVPRIGYVYPAGGRAGTTFEVAVGGQFLESATNVVITGGGVRATVVDFHKPMNQGLFNNLRDEARALQEKQTAAQRAARRGQPVPENSTNAWTSADERRLQDIRARILKNPPNRNATPAIAEVATVRVILEPGATPGDRELRLGAPGALSNPFKFQVGTLPEFSKPPAKIPNPDLDRFLGRTGRTTNAPPAGELRVTLPTIINGQIMPGVVDRFQFTARRGQKLVAAACARDLIPYLADAVPGWFQAALTLYDAQGHEVAYNDDFRLQPDPVLQCVLPAGGDYVLEIKDAIYRGREDFVYRITLGEVPFVTDVFPLGGAAGQITEVELQGWNLPTNRFAFDARHAAPGLHPLRLPDGRETTFAVDDLPEWAERESNDTPGAARKISLPVTINGRMDKAGDVDIFALTGKAGDVIVAEVLARRLDSPLDSFLQLTDRDGTQLAFNDDAEDKGSGLKTHHADARLQATLPADGDYFLRLGDTQGKGGPAHAYRLRVSPPRPDFALRVVPSAVNLRGATSAAVTVHALRRDGFTNEITLALKDAPPGFTLSGGRIPAGQDQVKLTLAGPALPADERFELAMEGRATIAGQPVDRPVVPADDLMQAFFYRHLVPAQTLQASVGGRFSQRGVVKLLSPTPVVIPAGGTARVLVGFPRGPFMDRLKFDLSDPPPGLAIKALNLHRQGLEITVASDAAQANPGLKGNLIFTASTARGAGADRPATAGRRIELGALPAVPFEIREAPGRKQDKQ